MILIADSRNPVGPGLSCTVDEFREFIIGAKNGDFDDLILQRAGARSADGVASRHAIPPAPGVTAASPVLSPVVS
jgi:hypothetical protein